MTDFLFYGAALIVTLGILVTFHEWGHYYAARKLGVKVLRFSVGFGAPLWKKLGKDGCEYVVAAIPLGGYVKMLDEREKEVPEELLHQSFNRQALWKRNIIIAAGPVANFVLAIFVFWGMYIYGVEAPKPVLGVVEPTSIAGKSGLKEGDTIVEIDSLKVSTLQDVVWRLAARMGDGQDIELLVKSENDNQLVERKLVTSDWQVDARRPDVLGSLGFTRPSLKAIIGVIGDGSAAEQVGMAVNDKIIRLNQTPISRWYDVTQFMESYQGGEIAVGVLRGETILEFLVTPKLVEGQPRIGVAVSQTYFRENYDKYVTVQQYGVGSSFVQALYKTWDAMALTATMFKKLVVGEVSTKSLGGPLSIAEGAGSSARSGLVYFLSFLGMISVNLGLINLLPIPLLDGGRLMFNLFEAFKGKPLADSTEEYGTRIGLVLVLGLMAIAIFNDIARL